MGKQELEMFRTNAKMSILRGSLNNKTGILLRWLRLERGRIRSQGLKTSTLEPRHQALLSNEPSDVQTEAMTDGGKPTL